MMFPRVQVTLEGMGKGPAAETPPSRIQLSGGWLLSNPLGWFPAWEPTYSSRSLTRYWIVAFHHHEISFCLNFDPENKNLHPTSGPDAPPASSGIFKLRFHMILA